MAIPTIHFHEPAYSVIQKLGGKSAVASELGLAPSTLSRWCQPSPEGTGGVIPQKHWPALLSLAKKQRIALKVSDLVHV